MTAGTTPNTTGTATCPFLLHPGGALRVVLDTNVLVSLYVFSDSRYAPLRTAIEDGHWQALASAACLEEFTRVLNYPLFALPPEGQQQALAAYGRVATVITDAPAQPALLPRCKDRDDQKFLELARDGGAQCLITSDKALLMLARRQKLAHLFRILTPDAALQGLQSSPSEQNATS